VFQAIADPTRRAIIGMLSGEAMSLNAVADNFEISRPAVSRHIRILRECGLVAVQKQGRERYCKAIPQPLNEVALWVEQYREFWEGKLDSLEDYLQGSRFKNNGVDSLK